MLNAIFEGTEVSRILIFPLQPFRLAAYHPYMNAQY